MTFEMRQPTQVVGPVIRAVEIHIGDFIAAIGRRWQERKGNQPADGAQLANRAIGQHQNAVAIVVGPQLADSLADRPADSYACSNLSRNGAHTPVTADLVASLKARCGFPLFIAHEAGL